MKIFSIILIALALSGPSRVAHAELTDVAGIRIVAQASDGSLVLDDSLSGLSSWATPGLAVRADEAVDSAPTLLVIGHVESWDAESGVLTVSGQTTTLTDGALIIDEPRDIEASLTAENLIWYLHEGSYIAVAGNTYGGGESLATHIVRLDNEARPGTVPVYVRGSLDLVDEIQRTAYIGNMALDMNGTTSDELPSMGNVIEVFAYQADVGRVIVSEFSSLESEASRAQSARLAGISGSGLKGISGSGLKGISGSGLKGISGSGLKGISGSGLKGISGSGLKGISGSGLKGISGSGLKGISGSGYSK